MTRIIYEPFLDGGGAVRVWRHIDGSTESVGLEALSDDGYADAEKAVLKDLLTNSCWPLPRFGRGMPEVEDGTFDFERLHDRIVRYLKRYVWLPDDRTYSLIGVWVIASYFREEFRFMPLLNFDGVTVAGKSTTMKAVQEISYRGFMTGSYSSASTVRIIQKWGCSFFLDESLDNLASDRGKDLANLLKAATSPDMPHIRADPKSQEVYTYHPYTSMAISTRGAEQPHDVVNRGIRIQMLTMPEDMELGSLSWADEEPGDPGESPESIRSDLYAARLLWMAHHREGDGWPDFASNIRRAGMHFSNRAGDGAWAYAHINGIRDASGAPRIWARQRDIATTLYAVAMECGCGCPADVLELVIESGREVRESAENTMEAEVFRAFVDCILEDAVGGDLDVTYLKMIVSKISTRRIAERFNNNRFDEGNAENRWETVPTKTVTHTLKALGLDYEQRGQRLSMMDPSSSGFVKLFGRYLKEYDRESIGRFRLT